MKCDGPFRRCLLVVAGLIAASAMMIALAVLAVHLSVKTERWADAAKRFMCIGLPLLSYAQSHGSLPPAYTLSADGRPACSWRVLILPEIGYEELFKRYDFNEPWDGPHNRTLVSEIPIVYQASSAPLGYTDVVAIVGKDTVWPGATGAKLNNVEQTSTLIMLVQAKEPRNWMEPSDLTYEDVMAAADSPGGLSALLGEYLLCVYADGHLETLPPDIAKEELQEMLKTRPKESRRWEPYR